MSKASGSIDLKSLKIAGEPNKYITKIDDDGITVHAADNVDLNYVQIDAAGMEVFKSNEADSNPLAVSVAEFGEFTRMGQLSGTHIEIDEDGIRGYNVNGTNVLDILLSGATLTSDIRQYFKPPYEYTFTSSSLSMTHTISQLSTFLSSGQEFSLIIQSFITGGSTHSLDYLPFVYDNSTSQSQTLGVATISYSGTGNDITFRTSDFTMVFRIMGIRYSTSVITPAWTFGQRLADSAIGGFSLAEGYDITASGNYSHAEGYQTIASGNYSHTEGYQTTASGNYSHAEGRGTTATNPYSHAEGYKSDATNSYAHAEGLDTTASGSASHAEGYATIAAANYSHAEGAGAQANQSWSHAQNRYTIAAKYAQTALGTYNLEDTSSTTTHPSGILLYGTYAVIIGNGESTDSRSNALTVDWSGNVNIASGAKYKINGAALSASDVGALATSAAYTRSSAGTCDWSTQADGNAKVIMKSALAYWNGAYSGTSSNLAYCNKGAFGTLATKNSLSASDVGALPNPAAGAVSEMGQYIDLHASGGAADYDVRLSCNAATTTGGGVLHINGQAMQDFIVAYGTSGSWTYRRWKSGKKEAWATISVNCSSFSSSGGAYLSNEITVTIPTAIGFTATPIIYASLDMAAALTGCSFNATSATSLHGYIIKRNSNTGNHTVNFYAVQV